MSDKDAGKKGDIAMRVEMRRKFDELDALIDLTDPAVFAARRGLGKAVGCVIDNSTVTAKTFPPYGENGGLHEPPETWPAHGGRLLCGNCGLTYAESWAMDDTGTKRSGRPAPSAISQDTRTGENNG